MKVITGNRVADGAPVYRTPDGAWTDALADAAAFEADDANDALTDALAEETIVVNPYIMNVDAPGVPTLRERMREDIRARGPSIHPQFARRQNLRSDR
jgi:hypothetical protein